MLIFCYAHSPGSTQTLEQCIEYLRHESGVVIPESDEDWVELKRTDVVIRRAHILSDAIKEAKKKKFDPTKFIRVRIKIF